MEKRIRYLTTDEKMTENIQKRIKQLIRAIGEGIWEKERILAMGVLCGISDIRGEPVPARASGHRQEHGCQKVEGDIRRRHVV